MSDPAPISVFALAATNTASVVVWGVVLTLALVVILCLAFVFSILNFWVQALTSGAPIHFMHLIGMRLRRVNPRTIVMTNIIAKKAGLDVTPTQLEIHYLAGGNIRSVVEAMIVADRAGADLDWDSATAIDLADRDVLGAARLLQAGELGSDLPIDQLPHQPNPGDRPHVTER
ncbi:MAG: flotillin-like FloA family protein [Planctomycetota bacterium]